MVNKKVVRLGGVSFGGNANNGVNCGFLYANTNNAPSNAAANIGSRLYFLTKPMLTRRVSRPTADLATKAAKGRMMAGQPRQAKNKSLNRAFVV